MNAELPQQVMMIGESLEQMGNNMQRCAETMQKQISCIINIIQFFRDLVLPQNIKSELKNQIEILQQLEVEKMEQMKAMQEMAEKNQPKPNKLEVMGASVRSMCGETFCTKDSATFMDNQKKLMDQSHELSLLTKLDIDQFNLGMSSRTLESLDLAYFYSQPLVNKVIDLSDSTKSQLVPLYDQLDCEEEYKKLVSILKQTQHLIRLTKTPLNFESFK